MASNYCSLAGPLGWSFVFSVSIAGQFVLSKSESKSRTLAPKKIKGEFVSAG